MRRMPDLKTMLLAAVLCASALSVAYAGCMMSGEGGCRGGGMGMGMRGGHSARHAYYMRHGLPAAYAGKRNPMPATPENIQAGKRLFQQNCTACHGVSGQGDGPQAKGLAPPPANLARAVRMPMMSDAYFLWTISEGGRQFGTAMPSMKATLDETQIWQLVLYLRQL